MQRRRPWLTTVGGGLALSLALWSCSGTNGGENQPVPAENQSSLEESVNDTGGRLVTLALIAMGLAEPVFITHAGDARLFIVERSGRLRVLQDGTLLDTPFLNLTTLTSLGGERGFLIVAFHPQYST